MIRGKAAFRAVIYDTKLNKRESVKGYIHICGFSFSFFVFSSHLFSFSILQTAYLFSKLIPTISSTMSFTIPCFPNVSVRVPRDLVSTNQKRHCAHQEIHIESVAVNQERRAKQSRRGSRASHVRNLTVCEPD